MTVEYVLSIIVYLDEEKGDLHTVSNFSDNYKTFSVNCWEKEEKMVKKMENTYF